MDSSSYSLADIASIVGKDNGFLGGNGSGFIILILFLLMMGGGFGNWGSTNAQTITNDFLYTNLASQNRDLAQSINTGFTAATNQNFAIQQDVLNQTNQINQNLCSGFNGVNSNIASLASQMAQQCCDLKTAVHSEAESVKALITENEVNRLRTDLQSAQLTLANANQTQNITSTVLNALGNYQPYTTSCGCSTY